jgi:hypothetical protein
VSDLIYGPEPPRHRPIKSRSPPSRSSGASRHRFRCIHGYGGQAAGNARQSTLIVPHGVRCMLVLLLNAGSSVRTLNTPSAVSTL